MTKRALDGLGDVSLSVDVTNRATFYARHWLEQLGVPMSPGSDVTIAAGNVVYTFGLRD